MGLFSFVLEVKNKTGSWHGSEAAFRLHAKNPMLPNNYSNELVVSSLSIVVFNNGLEDHSPWLWYRKLPALGGNLRESQRKVSGGNGWFKGCGRRGLTLSLSYLCSSPELHQWLPELLG